MHSGRRAGPQAVRWRTRAAQEANALPRDEFYTADAQPGEPGSLVRSEEFGGWEALADSTAATRMVYRTQSAAGGPAVASAAIATPDGAPPDGGWPVVAWAHGTSGVAPQCAPSLMKDLYYGDLIQALVDEGYAVVATDYSGLGAGDGHEYNTLAANANDVRYSVAAAQSAVEGLGERWVAMGHSQGGQAAWGAARQQADDPVGELAGAVSLAPSPPLGSGLDEVKDAPGTGSYAPYVASSLALQYPDEFEPADILTSAAMEKYEEITRNDCLALAVAVSGEATPAEYFKEGFQDNPVVQRYNEGNVYSDRPLAAPLFAATGSDDVTVHAPVIEAEARKQCAQGTDVEYAEFSGDHDGMVDSASEDFLPWIADRFAGREAPSNCE